MKKVDNKKVFARREVIGAGVIGAAYLALPDACSSGSSESSDAGLPDSMVPETGVADVQPEATLVEGGGNCAQTDRTRPISIMKTGIALKGTAYAFTDERFLDLTMQGSRILVINPLKGSGYVAMSGVCTHEGCSPAYISRCLCSTPGGIPQCVEEPADGDAEAGADAAVSEGGSGGEAEDGGADGGLDDADSDGDSDGGAKLMTDVLFCPCHQSVFNALNGKALSGPAVSSGDLQILDTCVGGGYVFVKIPKNEGAP